MDISFNVEDYRLNIRSAVIIIHNNKILLHRDIRKKQYNLPGGRVEIGEDSKTTVIREIKEELGKDIILNGYAATIENFFIMDNRKNHEIMFIHFGEFKDKNDRQIENTIKNVEGKDYLIYEWIDISKIDEYNLLPTVAKEIIKENKYPTYKLLNEIN